MPAAAERAIVAKKAVFRYGWAWSDGHKITLAFTRKSGEAVVIVRYQTPEYRPKGNTAQASSDAF